MQGRAGEAAEKRPNAAILSSSKGSRSACVQGNARFFVGRCGDLLRMTVQLGFSAACCARRVKFDGIAPMRSRQRVHVIEHAVGPCSGVVLEADSYVGLGVILVAGLNDLGTILLKSMR